MSKTEQTSDNHETGNSSLGVVSTRLFRGSKMILDDEIPVKVIYKAGDYVHIDVGNDNWTSVHYSRLS